MSLIPEAVGYEEQVQAFFLAFRGSGVALSPLDVDLLLDWKARGIPYAVVCRGIRIAAETSARDARPEEARLASLRASRKAVEAEFKRFLGRSVGRTKSADRTPEEMAIRRRKAAIAKLRKSIRQAPSPEHGKAFHAALDTLTRRAENGPPAVEACIARADEVMALTYVRAMSIAVRRELVREARSAAGPRQPGATPRARRDALRAHFVAVARMRGGLVSLA